MEDLLSKIYDKVAFYEEDSIKLGKEFDTIVTELLKPLREKQTRGRSGRNQGADLSGSLFC